jgi:protease-4
MKDFLKMLFATILGLIITLGLGGLIFLTACIAIFSNESIPKIAPESALNLDLNAVIVERAVENPFEKYSAFGYQEPTIGLNTLAAIIKKAKEDNNIKGIYLNVSTISASFGIIEELRNYLLDFKESGKFLYCYSDYLSQKAYYLASVSDKVFLHPEGGIDIRGLSSEIMFYKGLLDKIDMDMQIIRHGTYKSAVEPFMLDKMSEANKAQVQTYLNSMWNHIVSNISKSRSLDVEAIQAVCDGLLLAGNNERAVHDGFIDSLLYKDQFEALVHAQLGLNEDDKVNWISLKEYKTILPSTKINSDKIAVVYAVGDIVDTEKGSQVIGVSTISELEKARKDKDIKAIVFRINSGGGSALASESIWREVYLTQQEKPVVISMSDYAASGGYYIACAGSYIVAQPTTITGSIGVFGMIPNIEKLLANKLGVTVDRVTTNRYSDAISMTRPMTTYERDVLQRQVEQTYSVFTKRVADGRSLRATFVDSIGQGRVWSGVDALRLNLVDTLGGLDVAIRKAAELANTTDYDIMELPVMKDFLQEFVESFFNIKVSSTLKQSALQQTYTYFNFVESTLEMKGIQARIPYKVEIY